MEIHLKLYSVLREKLPKELNGETVIQMDEGATLLDLLDELDIPHKVIVSINGIQETGKSRSLNDGDEVRLFSSVSGG